MTGNTKIESLVYVCSASLSELKMLTAELENPDPRNIDAQLRRIEGCGTTLSSALDALSKYMDDLPNTGAVREAKKPIEDDGFLLRAAIQMLKNISAAKDAS